MFSVSLMVNFFIYIFWLFKFLYILFEITYSPVLMVSQMITLLNLVNINFILNKTSLLRLI